ncbi:MAG: hypothetical protein M1831_007509 [Alyxoria varia]|nr:MAG: hypothetical protein M1831_007509 [Alyxoria varia]
MAPTMQGAEFKTLDGLTLRGDLFPASGRGPAVIITPGFNCVKEMFVPEVAEQFQAADVTALVYDPRSIGLSDGSPRNQVDPIKQVSDYSDALTYMRSLPNVDPDNISFWGMSFSGTVALSAAALDRRATRAIAICPLLNLEYEDSKFPKVLNKLMQDRESQIAGNEPFYVPVLTTEGKNPAGMGLGADKEEFEYMVNAKRLGAPRHENRTTLQSYYLIKLWQPDLIVRYMAESTPTLIVIPELDMISPPEKQMKLHESFPSKHKKVYVSSGKGHLNVLSGEDFPVLSKLQVDFAKGEPTSLAS